MSHSGMTQESATQFAEGLEADDDDDGLNADDFDTHAQMDRAGEIADQYKGDKRHGIQTDVMNAFYQGVVWGREHPLPSEKTSLLVVPHTLGGFGGAYYVQHRREATRQEIFDAGVRSGLKRAADQKEAEQASLRKEIKPLIAELTKMREDAESLLKKQKDHGVTTTHVFSRIISNISGIALSLATKLQGGQKSEEAHGRTEG